MDRVQSVPMRSFCAFSITTECGRLQTTTNLQAVAAVHLRPASGKPDPLSGIDPMRDVGLLRRAHKNPGAVSRRKSGYAQLTS
jgi:hypothetical protein